MPLCRQGQVRCMMKINVETAHLGWMNVFTLMALEHNLCWNRSDFCLIVVSMSSGRIAFSFRYISLNHPSHQMSSAGFNVTKISHFRWDFHAGMFYSCRSTDGRDWATRSDHSLDAFRRSRPEFCRCRYFHYHHLYLYRWVTDLVSDPFRDILGFLRSK